MLISLRKLKPVAWLLLHCAVLVAFSRFAFTHNVQRMYGGHDGLTFLSVGMEQLEFFGKSLSLHSNILEGLGNLSLGINFSAIPFNWLPLYDSQTGHYTPITTYICYALVFFLSVRLTGWNYGFSAAQSYAAAWLMTLLFFDYSIDCRLYPFMEMVPHISLLFACATLTDMAFWKLGDGWRAQIASSFLLFLSIVARLTMLPVLMLLLPYTICSFMLSLLRTPDWRTRIRKIIACGMAGLVALCLGWGHYVVGLHMYTAAHFYISELQMGPLPLSSVSVLFDAPWFGAPQDRGAGTLLFVLASVGALVACICCRGPRRLVAFHMLVAQVTIVVPALLLMPHITNWVYPSPIYFEWLYLPLYGLFTIYFFSLPFYKFAHGKLADSGYVRTGLGIAALAILVLVAHHHIARTAKPVRPDEFIMPPPQTAITEVLQKEIAIRTGSLFAGRVASILPGREFGDHAQQFSDIALATGNNHMSASLWLQNIPTLVEYNQLITPYYYWFVKRFLKDQNISIPRNWTHFSALNIPALKLLGTRFLITDQIKVDDAIQRVKMNMPGKMPLYLYEFQGSNVAGLSALRIIHASSLEEVAQQLEHNHFDSETAVVLTADAPEKKWVKAISSAIYVEKGGLHITAESPGWTMLVLPFEYSHCLDITPLSGDMPQALRADGVLTGLVFNRKLDVKLDISTGIFHNPRCRFSDFQDFQPLVR